MPITLNPANVDQTTFTYKPSATASDAEKVLAECNQRFEELNQWIAPEGKIKPGTLRLVKNWDGTMELKRRQWYQFWNFMGNRDTGRAKAYVNSLTKYAANNKGIDENALFASYLEPASSSVVTKKELSSKLFHIEFIVDEDYQKSLNTLGVTLGSKLGESEFHAVYNASLKSRNEQYVFKKEREKEIFPISEVEGLLFHQRGDLAASLVPQLQNMTKPIFVVVALNKTPHNQNAKLDQDLEEYHCLPAMKAEKFVQRIAQNYPKAQVNIVGQIMERPPGNDLVYSIEGSTEKSITQENFDPANTPFQQVAYGLLKYLESAMENNYIHRDLKPENIIVHKNKDGNWDVKLINGRFAAYAGGNKLNLNSQKGTHFYMSPRVAQLGSFNKDNVTYGPETDCYSMGMVLLNMIDPESFYEIASGIKGGNKKNFIFLYQLSHATKDSQQVDESAYLAHYLEQAGSDSKISKILNDPANADVKNLIDLSFQASAPGEKGKAAYQEWKTAFAAWKAPLIEKGVIPKETEPETKL